MLEHSTHLARVADADRWGVAFALLLAGLAGGFVHCAAMCGPFVMAQAVQHLDAAPLRRLAGAALLPYHLGRATSYAALGAVLGGAGGAIGDLPGARFVLATALALAALLFCLQAFGRLPSGLGGGAWFASRLRPYLEDSSGLRGYVLGVGLGFLPCGFLYGALAAAAGTGSAAAGALALASFALGTVPALLLVGFAGAMAARRAKAAVGRIVPGLLLFNAAVLLWLAWRAVVQASG